VTSIGESAFSSSSMTSIVVESDNSVYDSHNNCNAIIETASNTLILGCKNTIIPSGVTSIEHSAFADCRGLTSVVIPSSVMSIGKTAFSGCSGLTSITSYITDVFETGVNAFYGCENATLYVPKGLVSIYQSIADWNRIGNIVERAISYDVNSDGSVDISDLVILVNAILDFSPMLESNDVNGDGRVDISDVVALVNMILNGTGQ